MVTPSTYRLMYSYAKKFSRSPNDIDDIVQESCTLLVKNPVEFAPNRFYFVLVKRGAYRFYFNTNTKESLNKDILLSENQYDLLSSQQKSSDDIELQYSKKEILKQLKQTPVRGGSHFKVGITKKEQILLMKILSNYEPGYEDRTHFNNLSKKLNLIFS